MDRSIGAQDEERASGAGRPAAARTGRPMKRAVALAVIGTALAVSGCSFLPAAGPTTSAIETGADVATAEGLFAR
ncbi:hypothetical protein ACIQ2M_00005, partial [Methylobacterium sp. NPDC097299]